MIEKTVLYKIINFINSPDFWIFNFSSEDKAKILENIRNSLYYQGLRKDFNEKYEYKESTKKRKIRNNRPWDRVTLKENGYLYNSLTVYDKSSNEYFANVKFSVQAKFDYADFLMSVYYNPNYIQLNIDEIKEIIVKKIKEKIIEKIKEIKRYGRL